MTTTASHPVSTTDTAPAQLPPGRRPVDWRRIRTPLAGACLAGAFVAAVAASLGSVVAGRLVDHATSGLVWLLAALLVGSAVVDTLARTMWATVVDRAEGVLRADLLDAALAQPLSELSEQAVGEVLDRIDDDTWEVGNTLRQMVWMAVRTLMAALPLWLVAGFTWWPAFALFPASAAATVLLIRRLLPEISRRKVVEEAAWTDHAAALEEGIAARDDLRTSHGQAFAVRRVAHLASVIHARLAEVLEVEVQVGRRTGSLLHGLLAAIGLVGIALVSGGHLSVGSLTTLFLVTTAFVGQVHMFANHLPDLQAGFGAVLRLRSMIGVEPEPVGGAAVAGGALDLRMQGLRFSYGTGSREGGFALHDVDLHVPAGTTCALVGRTGSGKSTLASLVSRAVEPPRGSVFLGDTDVRDLDLSALRAAVGVVTQRTEILAGTLAENITLFAPIPRERVEAAVAELGLTQWVSGLSHGLDTRLGPGGTTLSAGEEQLVAFARLLVRDVSVVILDEATARMDPVTEARVVRASDRLLTGRTGIVVAHRLSTTARAAQVAVLDAGRVVQNGPRAELAHVPGPFRTLLEAADESTDGRAASERRRDPVTQQTSQTADTLEVDTEQVGTARQGGEAPPVPDVRPLPGLARAVLSALRIEPQWGLFGAALFLVQAVTGAFGAVTGWVFGHVTVELQAGHTPVLWSAALLVSLMVSPVVLAEAFRVYPRWWIAVMLRVRSAVLQGQTAQHRLERTPPGEVVARAMDAERLARYADRWVDVVNGFLIAVLTSLLAGTPAAGAVLLVVLAVSALASSFGRRIAGRSAAAASAARARFGRSLVSAVESARTVKLAAATEYVHTHISAVDSGRVEAALKEHRVKALLEGVPVVMVQLGVVAAWYGLLHGWWSLATALLVATAVSGYDWFGRVTGMVVTEAPGTTSWMHATSRLAGGGDLMHLVDGIDLVTGEAPLPAPTTDEALGELTVRDLTAVHDDGTIGAHAIDLVVRRGELVLLLGQVGSGKSSLLGALAGLVTSRGEVQWNGRPVTDPQAELRPGRVAHVAQVPRVLSGTFRGNVALDHPDRTIEPALAAARLERDVAEAGGPDSLVGHRGVRLSGGQVQRLALARALACEASLLLADDVSSALDAATEIELWETLREQGATVLGATSKAAALSRADRVVVLEAGTVVDEGPWRDLRSRWSHLAG
ncbi:ATP-binding cassette domain-containing protein [Nocardioides acrostichi]|uniref:ABC transporter ATP-binding protein n=1 Tax=Nocardioides acrostichi TaxID=2784339 RepID=A0A930V332_9ACTN|nr:ABC transporter ATP-binding protein [Nocardioides acrostichi]MBF4162304.1 ABC transporter ATP-binding protein [Nocardioides acrostichi]